MNDLVVFLGENGVRAGQVKVLLLLGCSQEPAVTSPSGAGRWGGREE